MNYGACGSGLATEGRSRMEILVGVLGFRVLGFRVLGFRVLGLRVLGLRV